MKNLIKFNPNESIKNNKKLIDNLRNSKTKLEAKIKECRKYSSDNKNLN
jgi:hypothetical protein